MGDDKPKSQNLRLQVRETAWWARESSASCKEGSLQPSGQQGSASGGRHQGRSLGRGAALWCVELGCLHSGLEPASLIPWKWCTPPFWVFLISVLAPLMASVGFLQEPECGWSCSADMAVLITCADILSVSYHQMCLLWLRWFCSWTKVSWLYLGCHEWLRFVLYTLFYLDWTSAILWALLSTIHINKQCRKPTVQPEVLPGIQNVWGAPVSKWPLGCYYS